jgi:adenine-specific DNA-methyltransferase
MASELDVLLDKVDDPALRADLRRQVDLLRARRRFGLVFEEHLPERVQLAEHAIRRGTRVVRRDHEDDEPREVIRVANKKATVRSAEGETETLGVDDVVVVADFGEPIYPGLRRLGSLKAGGDKPAHVVIKGENHHVLEALQFTHAGKVDCIYIDPPYNTGERDWKYGNDYVDKDDAYRHSKWLAFMERRLRLAKQLLNPDDSALIVTIDEKEYLRLGLTQFHRARANTSAYWNVGSLREATRSRNCSRKSSAPGPGRRPSRRDMAMRRARSRLRKLRTVR